MRKKLLIFDLGGVVIDLHVEKSFAAFVGMGMDAAMLTEQKCLMNDMMQSYDRGDIDSDKFFSYIESFLSVAGTNQSEVALRERVREAWNMMLGNYAPEKIECLKMLRDKGYRIVMLSNTNEGHWDAIENKFHDVAGVTLNEIFHSLYLSYRIHRRKPEPEIFLELLEKEAAMPEEALFIDDSEENCAAARSVGIEALHVERNASWGNTFTDYL